MHEFLDDETGLWNIEYLIDTDDEDKINLINLAKEYNIPIGKIKDYFKRKFLAEDEKKGCASLTFHNKVLTDKIYATITFVEHLHNKDISIEAKVKCAQSYFPFLTFNEEIIKKECKTECSIICNDIKEIITFCYLNDSYLLQPIDKDFVILSLDSILLPEKKDLSLSLMHEYHSNKNGFACQLSIYQSKSKQIGVFCSIQDKTTKNINLSALQVFDFEQKDKFALQIYNKWQKFINGHYS
ncbi:MAG: hypothetical protein U9Q69_04050 [Nanoarchaeota archaeon]|nr:hypothetical protein [Nanoarchaeota archaeon]